MVDSDGGPRQKKMKLGYLVWFLPHKLADMLACSLAHTTVLPNTEVSADQEGWAENLISSCCAAAHSYHSWVSLTKISSCVFPGFFLHKIFCLWDLPPLPRTFLQPGLSSSLQAPFFSPRSLLLYRNARFWHQIFSGSCGPWLPQST